MGTLSVGQATRYRSQAVEGLFSGLRRLEKQAGQFKRSALVLCAHLVLAALSYSSAVFLSAQMRGATWAMEVLRCTLAFAVFSRLAASFSFRLYRRSFRHSSLPDAMAIAKAVVASEAVLALFVLSQFQRLRVPPAVFLMDAAFLHLLWCGLHFGSRFMRRPVPGARKRAKRTIIVGAGDAGLAILKEFAFSATALGRVVALVDDDSKKWHRVFYDARVMGGTKDLLKIASRTKADQILVCMPSATRSQMRRILSASRRADLPVKTLPSVTELLDQAAAGRVSLRDFRSPLVEDLLQRDEVRVDPEETRRLVGGKVVLVTGAGGSIGAELCRQIALAGPRKLLLLDKSENALFYVNLQLSDHLGAAQLKPYLADLLQKDRISRILLDERPQIVFHAAAHKHVGMLEMHPEEAIRNNVLGTRNIAEASIESGVGRFVNISTDKAVEPRSYMGLSKKLAELCIRELARSSAGAASTRFSTVRFGNVAGSTGSVLRLFWEQIQKGGPVQVTDPRATRYFMSIPEAAHLVLRAAALGSGGETFVLDMGKPLNIYELARTMLLFSGLEPETDIRIEFIGLRAGEKISEKLWGEGEHALSTGGNRVLTVRQKKARTEAILDEISAMEKILLQGDSEGLVQFLHGLFPDFPERKYGISRRQTSIAAEAGARAVGVA
ncbi:MAG TPA: nucleoside-diphosphate sugar epimerase/dehydratase [Candidatus Acidoferrales bacterium]